VTGLFGQIPIEIYPNDNRVLGTNFAQQRRQGFIGNWPIPRRLNIRFVNGDNHDTVVYGSHRSKAKKRIPNGVFEQVKGA
jgi:hypothetical protein